MIKKKRLFLIDGSALFYRAYYAMIHNPLMNAKGENVSAIYGFANSILKLWRDEAPERFVVVFDCKEPTFRHELYTDYKANRDEMPDDLSPQIPGIHEFLEVMGIPFVARPGFEADDILGTLAKQATRQGMEAYIVTNDKDFFQLLEPALHIYNIRALSKPAEPKFLDESHVQQKFGIPSKFMVDMLALMGDASDNVPGVSGVGSKTAAKLINAYGDLKTIYASLDKITSKSVKKKLEADRENAFLSHELVTIQTSVDCGLDPEQFRTPSKLPAELAEWMDNQSFPSLKKFLSVTLKEVAKDESPLNPVNTEPQISKDAVYTAVADTPAFKNMCKKLRKSGDLSVVLLPLLNDQFLLGLGGAEKGFVISSDDLSRDSILARDVQLFLEENLSRLAGYEVKSILKGLVRTGMPLGDAFFDVALAGFLLNAEKREPLLQDLLTTYCSHQSYPGEWAFQPYVENEILEPQKAVSYACRLVSRLKPLLTQKLKEAGMESLFQDYEIPIIRVLAAMEGNGIQLDVPYLENKNKEIAIELQSLVKSIWDLAGEEFNVNSTQQLGRYLFEKLKIQNECDIKKVKKTKTGYSTSSETLMQYEALPIVSHLLRYRMLSKLQSTYLEPLIRMVNKETGRLHAFFNQMVTVTGRLSSTQPNLQNIPIRTSEGASVRRGFIAPEGSKLISADYSQVELRILAHLSADEGMVTAFREKRDIHSETASKVFGVPLEEVTPAQRSRAKAVNFGVVYGMGPFRLSRDMGMSVREASQFIEDYFNVYQGVKDFIDLTIQQAHQTERAETLFGRIRPLPNINSSQKGQIVMAEHMAVNTPIQGTAADIIKKAMVSIQEWLDSRELKSRMLLQVHDELLFEVPEEELAEVRTEVQTLMENVVTLQVPLTVSVGEGRHWLEAHG